MSGKTRPEDWDVKDVVAFIDSIGLGHISKNFEENAVNGRDLLELEDEDFRESLQCSGLQVKKIKRELEARGAGCSQMMHSNTGNEEGGGGRGAGVDQGGGQKEETSAGSVEEVKKKLELAERGVHQYSAASDKLQSAESKLQGSSKALSASQMSQVMETTGDMRRPMLGRGLVGRGRGIARRGDFAHNMIEMGMVKKAQKSLKEAAIDIQAAQGIIPAIPYIEPAQVQQAMSGVILNALLMPGLAGDVMQMAKVKKAKAQVDEMTSKVHQAKVWCTKNMTAAQAEVAQLQAMVQMKEMHL